MGGASITEELWPGCRLYRLAYVYILFREEIVRDLGLRRRGLELIMQDPYMFFPFPDGCYIFFWNDREKTAKELAKFSYKDAKAYQEYEEFWDSVGEFFDVLFLSPPPT